MTVKIIQGDCRDMLKTLPVDSVHCCVTSPPYFNKRDYGCDGQIGLEKTVEEYVENLVDVFREVRRVLRPDGTCWIVIGDSYSQSEIRHRNRESSSSGLQTTRGAWSQGVTQTGRKMSHGLKLKDLMGIPWRVAFALRDDGWWLRSECIWQKPSCMPESVTDRPTCSHEHVFLLTKSARYYYDNEAVKELMLPGVSPPGNKRPYDSGRPDKITLRGNRAAEHLAQTGRNLRSVWTIAAEPLAIPHFAAFPTKLAAICIKAGTSEKGCCPKCGVPWTRVVERVVPAYPGRGVSTLRYAVGLSAFAASSAKLGGNYQKQLDANPPRTTGFRPSCECFGHFDDMECDEDWISRETGERKKARVYVPDGEQPRSVPCTVLDPFAGAGTSLLVADRLGRDAIGIELNPQYCEMARSRIAEDVGALFEAETLDDAGEAEAIRQMSLI